MKLPFDLDLSHRFKLSEQMVFGLREALEKGVWKPGDILPSQVELAEAAGVSEIVARTAIRQLADEGYVSPRRRIGCVVLDCGKPHWRGHVLVVSGWVIDNFYLSASRGVFRRALLDDGYLVSEVNVFDRDMTKPDLRLLESMLRQKPDLVLLRTGNPEAERMVRSSGVRWLKTVSCEKSSDTQLCFSILSAVRTLAARCRERGIRRVEEFVIGSRNSILKSVFDDGTFDFSVRRTPSGRGLTTVERVQQAALAYFEHRLSRPSHRLPDLLFVQDDYAASAVLLALEHHRVRIPEDVGFAIWASAGSVPPYYKDLTRIQSDPMAEGLLLARCVLQTLRGAACPSAFVVEASFVPGETV